MNDENETIVRKITFLNELEDLINKHSLENETNTPDFVLAEYIGNCLGAFEIAIAHRQVYYGDESDDESQIKPN